MKKLDISRPTITELLDEFSQHHLATGSAGSRRRLPDILDHLSAYLEDEGHRFLTTSGHRILDAEFEIAPERAFVRTMHADDLYYALPHYLVPEHAMASTMERRAQLDVIAHLADWLRAEGYVDGSTIDECIILDMDAAVRRGRLVLKA